MRKIRKETLLKHGVREEEADMVLDISKRFSLPLKLVNDFDDDEVRRQYEKEFYYFSIHNAHISQLEAELDEYFPSLPKSMEKLSHLKTLYLHIFDTKNRLPSFQLNMENLGWLKLLLFGNAKIPHHFATFPDLDILQIENRNRPSKRKNVSFENPEKIWELEDLTTLTVLYIELTDIPESIKKFKSLWRLTLWNNGIIHIPSSLLELENLKFIDLRRNPLDSESVNILMKLREKGLIVNY
ncbi:MAG: hypothetical protein GF311_20355 [Candidatus Lokiarchaeota archaeon]|nr:hypothetical protein [Candidatus Lokiarchaeota archaeon]